MRDEDDEDESDNESQERSFICEICSVATKSKEKIKRCKKTVIFYNALNTKGKKNKLAKLIVLPSALMGTDGCRRHRRTI